MTLGPLPIRLMHIVPCLGVGGLELGLLRILRSLSDGFDHCVVVLKPPYTLADQLPPGVRLHRMDARTNELTLPWRLRRLIGQERPEIIHARNFSAWPDVALANAGRRRRAAMIFAFHGFQQAGEFPWHRRAAFALLARLTDRMFTVSQAARELLLRQTSLDPAAVKVIPDGIDTTMFSPAPPRPPGGRCVIGSVGSLTHTKNHALLLQAAAMLLAQGHDLEIRIAGEGPQRHQLQRLAGELHLGDRLHLAGNVTDVAGFLGQLDLFVLPSRTEALPNALLEAMACGLACVASAVGGISELLDQAQAGLTVPPEDPPALAAAMARLIHQPQLRRQMGLAGRQRVVDRYDQHRMLAAYRRMYAVMARRRRDRRRPRVLMLCPSSPPPGGMATVLCNLLESDLARFTRLCAINTVKTTPPDRPLLRGLAAQLSLGGKVAWTILRRRIDLVHIHTCSGMVFWRDALHLATARLMLRKTVLHIHGGSFHLFALRRGLLRSWLLRRSLGLAHVVIVLHEQARESLQPLLPRGRWAVIPNGVPVGAAPPQRDGSGADFLYLGTLATSKGTDDIVDAAELACRMGLSGSICMAGPEDLPGRRRALQERIRRAGLTDRLRLIEPVDGPQKQKLLDESDVFLLPSYAEAMPMALLESMACGLAPVATPVGAIPQLVREGVEGLLVTAGDHKALAQRMLELDRDQQLRRRLGQASRQRILQQYSLDKMVERLCRLYQQVMWGE